MISLKLNTTVARLAKVEIEKDSNLLVSCESDSPLIAIKEALEKSSLELQSIDTFTASPGPGSYTGIRVGLAVAGALNFALGKKFKSVEPIY